MEFENNKDDGEKLKAHFLDEIKKLYNKSRQKSTTGDESFQSGVIWQYSLIYLIFILKNILMQLL